MEARNERKRACIVVLGDWGRSPRMQYHALSLANNDFSVEVVSYKGTEPLEELRNNVNVKYSYLKNVPEFEKYFPKLVVYILKTLWQSVFLFFTLMSITKPYFLLLQNPPSVPTLPVSYLACRIRGSKLIIDFHNYGYTILALATGRTNTLLKLYKWTEKYFSRKADRCLCVTKAMQEDLAKYWNVRATVFHDCPPSHFHPISTKEKHALFLKLGQLHTTFQQKGFTEKEHATRFTIKHEEYFLLHPSRSPLVISSTSWTEDEDFSVLLHALEEYEVAASNRSDLPDIVVAITGKGPQKEYYLKIIKEKAFKHVEIVTLWLEAEDYPKILASADLGVCLHKSSSGLDLPMKVVDMFGSCLPVCAIAYPCLNELVKHKKNGLIFSSSQELADQLQVLLQNFPNESKELEEYQSFLSENPLPSWNSSWTMRVLPLIQECI